MRKVEVMRSRFFPGFFLTFYLAVFLSFPCFGQFVCQTDGAGAPGISAEKNLQVIDQAFLARLEALPDVERAVFVDFADQQQIFYLRFSKQKWKLRGQLDQAEETCLPMSVWQSRRSIFSPEKADGMPLYQRGVCISGNLMPDDCKVSFIYVPHAFAAQPPAAFICDRGYLEVSWSSENRPDGAVIDKFLQLFTGNKARLSEKADYQRLYQFRDNFDGHVNTMIEPVSRDVLFMPLHKATLNKGVDDITLKAEKDCRMVLELIAGERFLLSQDMRCKLGMVPSQVSIKFSEIENTDIGSGQNQLIFLSSGPGINYFDNPWQSRRKNVPCPRLLFHRSLYDHRCLQVFPTYSIAPEAKGYGRLAAINLFQDSDIGSGSSDKKSLIWWCSQSFRKHYLREIENAVCRYGLTNDDTELAPGMDFRGMKFAGNIINNELRFFQALPVRDLLKAVIVPAGWRERYENLYREILSGSSLHWEFNCAVHYRQLFIESPISTDKGFRSTWLMLVLRESHPVLYRLLRHAASEKKNRAFLFIGDRVSEMVSEAGRDFFITTYLCHFRNLEAWHEQAWLDYLAAYRNSKTDCLARFKHFQMVDAEFRRLIDF